MGQAGRLAPSGLRVACRSAFRRARHARRALGMDLEHLAEGSDVVRPAWRAAGIRTPASSWGRCANSEALAVTSRRSDVGVRCCAGEVSAPECEALGGARQNARTASGRTEPRGPALADAIREKAIPDLPGDQPFRVDRILWHWHPRRQRRARGGRRLLAAIRRTSLAEWRFSERTSGCRRRRQSSSAGRVRILRLVDARGETRPRGSRSLGLLRRRPSGASGDASPTCGEGFALGEAEKALPHGVPE